MSFQNKDFWMPMEAGCQTDGEVNCNNLTRIEPKRSQQWFMDDTGAEPFNSKKQATESCGNRLVLGISNTNVPQTANLVDKSIPAVNGGSLNMGRMDSQDQYNDASRGFSMYHFEDPSRFNIGGIRNVNVNQVKDFGTGLSMGTSYGRGDNYLLSEGTTVNKRDNNMMLLGPNKINSGKNTVSRDYTFGKSDFSFFSMNRTLNNRDENHLPIGYNYCQRNDISLMCQSFGKGNGNFMSSLLVGTKNSAPASQDSCLLIGTMNLAQASKETSSQKAPVSQEPILLIGTHYSAQASQAQSLLIGAQNSAPISQEPSLLIGTEKLAHVSQEQSSLIGAQNSAPASQEPSLLIGTQNSAQALQEHSSLVGGHVLAQAQSLLIGAQNSAPISQEPSLLIGAEKLAHASQEQSSLIGGQNSAPASQEQNSLIGTQNSAQASQEQNSLIDAHISDQPSQEPSQLNLVETNEDSTVNIIPVTNHGTVTAPKRKTANKAPVNDFPSSAKSLLSTGMLDGIHVKYVSWSREKNLKGTIKGNGYLCGCTECNFTKAVNVVEFESHANCKTRHPNNHIYFGNGKTLYGVVQELKYTPQDKLFDAIQNVTGSQINQKNFDIWKASYIAATHELQNIYKKDDTAVVLSSG